MDQKRIFALRDKVERVSVSTAVLLLSFSNRKSLIIPMDSQRVKEIFKNRAGGAADAECGRAVEN